MRCRVVEELTYPFLGGLLDWPDSAVEPLDSLAEARVLSPSILRQSEASVATFVSPSGNFWTDARKMRRTVQLAQFEIIAITVINILHLSYSILAPILLYDPAIHSLNKYGFALRPSFEEAQAGDMMMTHGTGKRLSTSRRRWWIHEMKGARTSDPDPWTDLTIHQPAAIPIL